MKRQLFTALLLVLLYAAIAHGQTTTFTYQGRLNDSTITPTTGVYDFEFRLFTLGGAQIGPAQTRSGVQVNAGAFTVTLDYGSGAFSSGGDRFLEISVKRAVDPTYLILTPRQQLTSAPYAVRSLDSANLGGTAANQFVHIDDPRLTDDRDPTIGSPNYIQNSTSQQPGASFNIEVNGTVGGTLSGNIVNATTQYNIGGNRIFHTTGSSNVFIGLNSGSVNTAIGNTFVGQQAGAVNSTGTGNTFVGSNSGDVTNTGSANTFVGSSSGGTNTTGAMNVFVGRLSGNSNTTGNSNTLLGDNTNLGSNNLSFATAIGASAVVSTSNTVQLGRANGGDTAFVPGHLSVAILGAAGATAICRNASNQISTCSSSLRYKTNIATFTPGLDVVRKLRPITFDWKADGAHDVGFGAEDVARISELLVTRNADGQVEGVKYDRISTALVNAVNEQQATIERQQHEIDQLKAIVCGIKPDALPCQK